MSVIDLIIRIKNGYMAKKERIVSPYSNFRIDILNKLKQLSYIQDFVVREEGNKTIEIVLAYSQNTPAITDISLMSKPGQRYYVSYTELSPVQDGMGTQLISTSKGILTDKEAKKQRAGGELLFKIW